jgi:hypothetical protein
MSRWLRGVGIVLALLVWSEGEVVRAQEQVTVTVRQLFERGHRLEVTAGHATNDVYDMTVVVRSGSP